MTEVHHSLIALAHIHRTFMLGGHQVHALCDVSLNIEPSAYLSIMGPSGSGKSTLLHLIGLLDHADSGTYQLAGRDVTTHTADELAKLRNAKIGFIFQSFHLVPRLSAAANIELPLMLANMPSRERKQRVAQALDAYGLTDRAEHRPNELSGGQRQRVAIARATILRPAVLLADEPTGNLDRATGEEVLHLLETLNQQGTTLIVVTHDPMIGRRAHRQLCMQDGKVVSDTADTAPSQPT